MNYDQYLDHEGVLSYPLSGKLDCSHDTRIIKIIAPQATSVYCRYCSALTSLDLPQATSVYCSGCSALVDWFQPQVVPLLEAGGKSAKEIIDAGAWD